MRPQLLMSFLLTLLFAAGPARAQDPGRELERGQEKLLKGLYKSALRRFDKALENFDLDLEEEPDNAEWIAGRFQALMGRLTLLRVRGEYHDAVEEAEQTLQSEKDPVRRAALQVFRCQVLQETGKYDKALEGFRAVVATDENNLRARLGIAECLRDLGKRDEAFKAFDWFVEFWSLLDKRPDAEVLETVGRAAAALGVKDQDLYLDAQKLLERCEKDFPKAQDARVHLALLYINRYARNFAKPALLSLFKANPNHPDGRAAMALYQMGAWRNKDAAENCNRALAVNPNHVAALKVSAMLRLNDEDPDGAQAFLQKALAVNPNDAEALSLNAAVLFLRGDTDAYDKLEKQIMARRPDYGRFYHLVGELVGNRRRLKEAVAFNRKAIEVDPLLWEAYFALGTHLSREGQYDEAKTYLEKGFKGDSYNRMAKNLLTLFDDYDHFVARKSENFKLLFHKSEVAVMAPYTSHLLEESWSKLTEKYKFLPRTPVMVEMFHRHDDFAVRTLGFPGLGALGACFGPLITLDSPRARGMGGFNWASTTWHEFAHVVTVQLSKGRVPRWFTEGCSVYEERCGRPYWVRGMHRLMLGRLHAGGLTPLPKLNAEFTRGNVLLAYFHASWVIAYIVDAFGMDKVIEMLKAYGQDKNDDEAAKAVFGKDLAALDVDFKAWLKKRFAHIKVSPLFSEKERRAMRIEVEKNPDDPGVLSRYARACLQNGKLADAEINAGKARRIKPDCAEACNVLGELFYLKKRLEAAEKYFLEAVEAGSEDYNVWLRLATIAERAGDMEKAVGLYEKARDAFPEYAAPPDSPYRRLSVLYGRLGREADALKAKEFLASRLESDVPLRLELATLYRRKGDGEKLEKILRELHEIWPFGIPKDAFPEGKFNTHLVLGGLLKAKGDMEGALVEAEVAMAESQLGEVKTEKVEELEVRLFLIECLLDVKRFDDAEDQLEEILEYMDPENARALALQKRLEQERQK